MAVECSTGIALSPTPRGLQRIWLYLLALLCTALAPWSAACQENEAVTFGLSKITNAEAIERLSAPCRLGSNDGKTLEARYLPLDRMGITGLLGLGKRRLLVGGTKGGLSLIKLLIERIDTPITGTPDQSTLTLRGSEEELKATQAYAMGLPIHGASQLKGGSLRFNGRSDWIRFVLRESLVRKIDEQLPNPARRTP